MKKPNTMERVVNIVPKLDLKMRLTFLFLIVALFQIKANSGYAQNTKISLDLKQSSLTEVFAEIENKTEFKFFYKNEDLDFNKTVNLKMKNKRIETILDKIFHGQDVMYEIYNKHIVLRKLKRKPKPKNEVSKEPNVVQVQISGSVADADGAPLPGANIVEKGTSNGTQTDFDGNFQINVADANAVLVVSYIGFATQEISLNGQTQISVSLKEDTAGLDEVVVIGYGSVKKSDLTGAVSSVKSEDLQVSNNVSVEQALSAKAAGLTITSASGQPGAGVNIVIRGAANTPVSGQSTQAANQPLYVIDGFPVTGGIEPGVRGGVFNNAGSRSPLNDINPNDIESVQVLKDASATAIYGSRAANGVILITTKRGKTGAPKVEYSSNYTSQSISKWLDLLNAQEFMTARNEVIQLHGEQTGNPNPDLPYTAEQIANAGEGTDWFDAITRTGYVHQQNISVSGGGETTKYLASFNYFDQEGVLKNSELTRFTGRLNLDQNLGKHIKFGLSLAISQVINGNVPLGGSGNENAPPLRAALNFDPTIPIRDADGNFSVHPTSGLRPNPVSLLDIDDTSKINRLFTNFFLEVTPFEGLSVRTKVGVDSRTSTRNSYVPTTTILGAQNNGIADKSYNERVDKLFGATITYNKTIQDHSLSALVGYEYQEFTSEGFDAGNTEFITDGLLFNDLGAGTGVIEVGSYKSKNELASYFSRLDYNYKDKYYLTASVRADGSPQFGKNNRWGYFPSVALAWKISEEDFMSNLGAISNLKLRAGYGETGFRNPRGIYTARYGVSNTFVFGNGVLAPGVRQTRLENPDLKWQTNSEYNFGLDFGLFNNRISGTVEYYTKEVKDLLGTRQLRSYLPINTIIFNVGSTSSKGVEATLNTINVNNENFRWTSNFTFGTFTDRWETRDPNINLDPHVPVQERLRSIYAWEFDGIYQEGDPIPESQPNIRPGQVRVKDIRGVDDEGNLTEGPDGNINLADLQFIGTSDPGFTYGIANNFTYKNIDFSFFLRGMGDRLRYNATRETYLIRADRIRTDTENLLAEFKNRWTPTNTGASLPSGLATSNNLGGFTSERALFIEKAGFLRLQNVTLGYSLPHIFGDVVQKARIYVQGENLFVSTKYTGIDPEYDSVGAYPNQRSFTLGLNVTF